MTAARPLASTTGRALYPGLLTPAFKGPESCHVVPVSCSRDTCRTKLTSTQKRLQFRSYVCQATAKSPASPIAAPLSVRYESVGAVATTSGGPQTEAPAARRYATISPVVPRVQNTTPASPLEFITNIGAGTVVPVATSTGALHVPPFGRSAVKTPVVLATQTAVASPVAVICTVWVGEPVPPKLCDA